jgi:hypothetical protein
MKKEEKYIDSKHLKRIFSGEINSQYFLHGKSTYGDILSLAAGYIDEIQKLPAGSVICICTERRDLIVAAFVASLFSDSLLILPFSLSAAALQDVSDATSFQYYVGIKTFYWRFNWKAKDLDQNSECNL